MLHKVRYLSPAELECVTVDERMKKLNITTGTYLLYRPCIISNKAKKLPLISSCTCTVAYWDSLTPEASFQMEVVCSPPFLHTVVKGEAVFSQWLWPSFGPHQFQSHAHMGHHWNWHEQPGWKMNHQNINIMFVADANACTYPFALHWYYTCSGCVDLSNFSLQSPKL